jgi:predicted phage replisome organizer
VKKLAEPKKYYWLKLYRGFFKRHDMRIIEQMPNGKLCSLFYLKLMLESIDHEGTLRFSEEIPYDNEMLSAVTDTEIEVVNLAMEYLLKLKMIEFDEDKTIILPGVQQLIGSAVDNDAANRQRRSRERKKQILAQNVTNVTKNVTPSVTNSNESKSIEKELDKELELDVAVATGDNDDNGPEIEENTFNFMGGKIGKGVVLLTDAQIGELLDKLGIDAFNHYVEKLADFIIKKNAKVSSHYATILKWAKQDSNL